MTSTEYKSAYQQGYNDAMRDFRKEPSRNIEEIKEVINCDVDAETKCKMISNILTAKPHYFKEPKYCDRNICVSNEYNSIGCDECEITKSQNTKTGHWIPCTVGSGLDNWECSECGRRTRGKLENLPYCCCGAKMSLL